MELGMIGLGRMGANMAERLIRGGHRVFGWDRSSEAIALLKAKGGVAAQDPGSLVQALAPPRAVWLMVPAGEAVDSTLAVLARDLRKDDVVLDGGNSNYRDSLRRAADLQSRGIHFIDVGTSGGLWGLAEGYSLMIGGDAEPVERLRSVFQTLAPAPDRGWGRVGPAGSGHFVKMIHNGIEYGMMQAYAEGLSILRHKEPFGLDLPQVAEIWRSGSVIRSWLLDLTASVLARDPKLADVAPWVADSGEGRWTVDEAIDLGVAAPVITLALLMRLRSRDEEDWSDRLLAAMRHEFGGHPIRKETA